MSVECLVRREKINTSTLLETVSRKLSLIETFKGNNLASDTESFYATLYDLAKTTSVPPDDLSRLLAIIHCILESRFAAPEADDAINESSWPCPAVYNGEIKHYKMMSKKLDVSILNEINVGCSEQYCYAVFSFVDKIYAYHVQRFSRKSIPQLLPNEKDNDGILLREIYLIVVSIVKHVLWPYAREDKFKCHEFSMDALLPDLPKTEEQKSSEKSKKSRKRKRVSTGPTRPPKKFPMAKREDYCYLKGLFEKENSVNAASVLMSVIHQILVRFYKSSSTLPTDKWPVNPKYKNEVYQIWISDKACSKIEETGSQFIAKALFFGILENAEEYFIVLRPLDNEESYCVKRINKILIPSFKPDEEELDQSRFRNIQFWFCALFLHYIYPTLFIPTKTKKTTLPFNLRGAGSAGGSSHAPTPGSSESGTATPRAPVLDTLPAESSS